MILGLWHYPGQSIFEGDNPRGFWGRFLEELISSEKKFFYFKNLIERKNVQRSMANSGKLFVNNK